MLSAGKEVRRSVKIGAVGAALTEIVSGLTEGDQVVLADLNAAVPSSSSSLTGGGGFFGRGGGQGRALLRQLSGAGTAGSGVVTFGAPPG
jgi:hypothetical protein